MLKFTVSMPKPHTHYIHVELKIDRPGDGAIELGMPVWTPGAYEVHDFAGKVHSVEALDAAGRELAFEKVGKNSWRLDPAGSKVVRWRYQVYAFEIDVDKSFLDSDRALINGAGVFMYVEGRRNEPIEVEFKTPRAWKRVDTGLDSIDDRTFRAAHYDELVDCPVVMGSHRVETFDVRGVPHKALFVGPGNYEPEKVLVDTAKVVEAAADVFGEIPYKNYTFIIENAPDATGGLEHRNSTHMIFSRWKWKPRKDYVGAMGLISHEFFHTWNVKRLRPHPLGPFDYAREVYTPLLWFAEGFTSYYDNLLLRRSGVITVREYLTEFAREIRRLRMTPGRNLQSLEESSFDTWIKFYRPHADSHNTTISYYNKGALFAWMLDFEIRRASDRKHTLDDVMRLLYQRFHKENDVGIRTEDIENACREVAGRPLTALFDSVVRGRGDIEAEKYLAWSGLRLVRKGDDDSEGAADKPYLGIRTKTDNGCVIVSHLLSGSPAYEAGLSVRDELIALEGFRINEDRFEKRVGDLAVGKPAKLLVSRAGMLREIEVTPGARPEIDIAIEAADKANAEEKSLCRQWLAAEWKAVEKAKSAVDFRPREKVL